MSEQRVPADVPRRAFLSRLAAGAAAFGAAFGGARAVEAQTSAAPTPAPTAAAAASGWQPARHAEDDWFEQTAAKHRFFQDTTSPETLGQAMAFARNFFEANASGYGLTDTDLAQVLCLRHRSTPFAFSDAMWAKYGAMLSERADGFVDPKSKQVPSTNLYQVGGYGQALRNNGVTLDSLTKRGVRLAVCAMATRRAAQMIADKNGVKADEIYKELTDHLVPNAHMVPAGIVAVNRAQERGYTSLSVV